MRNTIVYVLRLLIDENDPEGLRGVLRNVISGEEQSFVSEQGLIELLRHRPAFPPTTQEENQIIKP